MSDEGLTFDEWIWRAELLAAHGRRLALLVPMLAGWLMPRWPPGGGASPPGAL